MKLNSTIQKVVAIMLLLTFVLGATPKSFLHNAVTNHQHQQKIKHKCSHHHITISEKGYNCQIDNLVVEMPFAIVSEPSFLLHIKYSISHNKYFGKPILVSQFFAETLRGPPACL